MGPPAESVALELTHVGLRIGSRWVLQDICWTVTTTQRWVVLGPNGSGKTSLAQIAALQRHPSAGTLRVLGAELGRDDIRPLRSRVGLVSAAVAALLRPALSTVDAVMTARHGALEPWWHDYDDADRRRAGELLERLGLAGRGEQPVGTLSSGELQRAMLARALMADPGLLIADEPHAGLDLGAREELIDGLDRLAADPTGPPIVLITHHVEEIPPSFTHLLALRDGSVVAQGPLEETLNADLLRSLFGLSVAVGRDEGGRFWARKS
jgi:iron complex transport system ATP-binding protein